MVLDWIVRSKLVVDEAQHVQAGGVPTAELLRQQARFLIGANYQGRTQKITTPPRIIDNPTQQKTANEHAHRSKNPGQQQPAPGKVKLWLQEAQDDHDDHA